MDIFRFVIGNSWKEYDIIYFKYHITPFLTRIMYIYTYVCISTFILYGEDVANEQSASLNIVAKCLDIVSKLHRSTNILYFHRISDPHPLYLFDFLMSKSPTSYNASWWCRNDVLFYLILACMWCIKLIMQEK